MAQLNPYLVFKGNCGEAMRFYAQVLSGTLDIKTHAESLPPEHVAPGAADLVMHARLEFDGNVLMASDDQVGAPKTPPAGFALSLNYKNADDARRVFNALAEGGNTTMPIEKTFWSEAFGMLVDRFGMPWMVNTEA